MMKRPALSLVDLIMVMIYNGKKLAATGLVKTFLRTGLLKKFVILI